MFLVLAKAELRCSKADSKPSVSSIGTSVKFYKGQMEVHIHWDRSHTLGPLVRPIMVQLVLLSSGREDERFTVEFKTNMSLTVDSVRLWSGFEARRVVVDGEM